MNDLARWRPTILIVEDELLIRLDAIEMIQAAGFETLEAANADEAIAILETRPDVHSPFCTDIQMPGSMDGVKLAHFVRERWPPVKIIATSAHTRIEGIPASTRRPLFAEALFGSRGNKPSEGADRLGAGASA